MGQATVHLPDPSNQPAAPIVSADDLLSQMAGDEIDRLLAEAEVEKSPAGNDALPDMASMIDAPTEQQLDALLADLNAESNDPADTAVAAVLEPQSDQTAQHPVAESTSEPLLLEPKPEGATPGASAIDDPSAVARELEEAIAKGSALALPEVKPPETETSRAEKSALAEVTEAMDNAAPDENAEPEPVPVPMVLKPLVWFNAPMMLLPPAVRDAIGQVAILTLVNALAVLAYVMIFRKH